MPVMQQVFEVDQRPSQVFRRIVVVVQMDLDLAKSLRTQAGQRVKEFWFVFLGREEERVPGRTTIAVAEIGEEARVVVDPAADPRASLWHRGPAQFRFEVVANGEEQM